MGVVTKTRALGLLVPPKGLQVTDHQTGEERACLQVRKQLGAKGPQQPGQGSQPPKTPGFPPAASLPLVLPPQYRQGGPVIAVQVENEYGSFAKDRAYMPHLHKVRNPVLRGFLLPSSSASAPAAGPGRLCGFPTGERRGASLCPVFSTGPAEQRDCGAALDLGRGERSAPRQHKRRYAIRLLFREHGSASPARCNSEQASERTTNISEASLCHARWSGPWRGGIAMRTQGQSEEFP